MRSESTLQRSIRSTLDELYRRYNRREFVHPDPLEFLYRYERVDDREVAGLIASGLAYGRVAYILKSVGTVLDRLGPAPAAFLDRATERDMRAIVAGVVHRWTTREELEGLLLAMRRMRATRGTLRAGFERHYRAGHENVLPALTEWVTELRAGRKSSLLPDPSQPSACKRLHLYLRWMVRKDEVDPGGWDFPPASKLLVPLDVHMHRVARKLKFTRRRQANLRTVLDVTLALRKVCPHDPVKYDFALTRPGIWGETG